MAYINELTDGELSREYGQGIRDHFTHCEPFAFENGIFNRWPDGSGGDTSHDEIMGAAALDPWIAQRLLSYLEYHNYMFNNQARHPTDLQDHLGMWQGRFLFLRPFLHHCAGYHVPIHYQIVCAAYIMLNANAGKEDCGGRLKTWLLIRKMSDLKLIRFVGKMWAKTNGMSLKECLTVEPKEYPVFASNAPLEGWML